MEYATKEELNKLTIYVKANQDSIETLNTSIASLDTMVGRINHISTMKDTTITYLTEGDILQYNSDGTWHNVQPGQLGSGTSQGIDEATTRKLIQQVGSLLFLSKTVADTANGAIQFKDKVTVNGQLKTNDITIGQYAQGLTGGMISSDADAELKSLVLRESLTVPVLDFNRITVTNGETWQTVCCGEIEAIDTTNCIITLKLNEGEYSGIQINDICRGVYHFTDNNNSDSSVDDCGFESYAGFTTVYFSVTEVLDAYGKQFKYSLRTGSQYDPQLHMKFVVYGNFSDETRQSSAYSTRTYTRYLKGVNTWVISNNNIASQFGKLDGLHVEGAPNNGDLTGDGAYLDNVYLTGAVIQFTKEQLEQFKGKDAYTVSLSSTNYTVKVNNDMSPILDANKTISTSVSVLRGDTALTYSEVVKSGTFNMTVEATGVKYTQTDNTITITSITDVQNMSVKVKVNCEGEGIITKDFILDWELLPDAIWVTYNDSDSTPTKPTGDGSTDGWHRDFTSTVVWMSNKSSRVITEGEWSEPVRIKGESVKGEDAPYQQYIYKLYTTDETPTKPTGTEYPPEGWSKDILVPDQALKQRLYQCVRTVNTDKTYTAWSNPLQVTALDGTKGDKGDKGDTGNSITYSISPSNVQFVASKDLQITPASSLFTCYKQQTSSDGTVVSAKYKVNWFIKASTDGVTYTDYANATNVSEYTFKAPNILSTDTQKYYQVLVTAPTELTATNPLASVSFTILREGQDGKDGSAASSSYTMLRCRGEYDNETTYYYDLLDNIPDSDKDGFGDATDGDRCYIRDYVYFENSVYMVEVGNASIKGQIPKTSGVVSNYWAEATQFGLVSVNTLLAKDAKLGQFNFSNNIFSTANGKLSMDSETGKLVATDADIKGAINVGDSSFSIDEKGIVKIGNFTVSNGSLKASSGEVSLILGGQGIRFSSEYLFAGIGEIIASETGYSDMVAAYFKVNYSSLPLNSGAVMISTTGGSSNANATFPRQVALKIETSGGQYDTAIDFKGRLRSNGQYGMTFNGASLGNGYAMNIVNGLIVSIYQA